MSLHLNSAATAPLLPSCLLIFFRLGDCCPNFSNAAEFFLCSVEKEKIVLGTFSVPMDGGGADLPCQFLFSHPEMPDSFDEFLNSATTTTCSHTHSCNSPGTSAAAHTHTCLHTHTQVFAGGGGEDDDAGEDSTRPRKPLGNREAVRKYREKKKAHAAFLEEEVKKLRATNQQLLRRLQSHAALEAEVVRLRGLLLDVRGKIDAEVAAFPFPKQCSVGSVVSADQALCFNGNSEVVGGGAWDESCRPTAADCGIDEGGGMFGEIGISEAVNSMDVRFVTSD
ncbi:hypothetical protein EJB05_36206, partial [Eragrostis curvula]